MDVQNMLQAARKMDSVLKPFSKLGEVIVFIEGFAEHKEVIEKEIELVLEQKAINEKELKESNELLASKRISHEDEITRITKDIKEKTDRGLEEYTTKMSEKEAELISVQTTKKDV